jgi:quercetin dioxygenase-like cupin family protein
MQLSTDPPIVADTKLPPQTLIVPPDGGEEIRAYGATGQIKLSGEQTNGLMVVAMSITPPGAGPPPHRHFNEDEMLVVVEGSISYFANGQWTEPLQPGSIVYTPRGAVHTYQNVGETPCRQWVVATPSGFEKFLSKSAEVFAAAGPVEPPDMERIVAISDAYGIEFVPPLVVPGNEPQAESLSPGQTAG